MFGNKNKEEGEGKLQHRNTLVLFAGQFGMSSRYLISRTFTIVFCMSFVVLTASRVI